MSPWATTRRRAGLEGAGWGQKTTALADENGLLKDVNNGTTQGLPRQYAAQLIFNAVNAATVEYRDGEYYNKNLIGLENDTIGEKYMGLNTAEGTVEIVGHNSKGYTAEVKTNDLDADKNQITVKLSSLSFDPTEYVGKAVKALYKETDEVYGMFVDSEETLVEAEGIVADLKVKSGKVELDDVEYDTESTVEVVSSIGGTHSWKTLNDVVSNNSLKASKIVLIDNNGDEEIDIAVVTPTSVAKVDNVDETDISFELEYGPEVEDVDTDDDTVYADIAADDYVLYVGPSYTADGNALVTKADVVSGTVSSTKGENDVKVDGTWYTLLNDTNSGLLSGEASVVVLLGDNAILVDTDGGSVSINNLVYIQDAEVSTALGAKNKVVALAYTADGTDEEITVSRIDGKDVVVAESATEDDEVAIKDDEAATTALAGKLFTYTKASGEYRLTEVSGAQTSYDYYATLGESYGGENALGVDDVYAKGTDEAAESAPFTTSRIDDDAVVFVNSEADSEVKVITGSALKAWKDTNYTISKGVALIDGTSGYRYAKVIAFTMTDGIPGASSDTMYGYITSDVESIDTEDGTKYTFTVWNGSDNETVTTTDSANLAKDVFIAYEYDGDDIVLADGYDVMTIEDDADYVAGLDGDDIMFSDGKTYNMDDDETQVIFVRTKSHEGATGSLKEATQNTADKYYVNVIPVIDDEGTLVALFADASNKMYIDDEAQLFTE